LVWRFDFIQTFLERDVPQMGFRLPAASMRRFWQMLAHSQGQVLNSSKLGAALGLSHTTIRSHIDMLAAAFLVRVIPPWSGNLKKRLVRSPKVYLRDSGILHALLELDSYDSLAGHPAYGHSFEGMVLENVCYRLCAQGGAHRSSAQPAAMKSISCLKKARAESRSNARLRQRPIWNADFGAPERILPSNRLWLWLLLRKSFRWERMSSLFHLQKQR
jgi:hypothetical protein